MDLLKHYRDYSLLNSAAAVLYWDMETMMPKKVAENRGAQLELLSALAHRHITQKDFLTTLTAADISDPQLKKMKRLVLTQQAFDEKFVAQVTKAEVETHHTWIEARKDNSFKKVAPLLKRLVDLKRDSAKILQEKLPELYASRTQYEVHLDQFEPGFEAKMLRKLLGELKDITASAIETILKRDQVSVDHGIFNRSIDEQKNLNRKVAEALGLDFDRARMDESTHPFMTNLGGDLRITTRYSKDYTDSLSSTIHETGHAIYEQNLPENLRHTPCGSAASMGIHESQSRFFENMIGRSMPFCEFLSSLTGTDPKLLFDHINKIERGYIRVDADEVTYNQHIYLRMMIEEDLMEGKIQVDDLPERWNSDFLKLTGMKITEDRLGVLQDTHWYGGAFGYFPTYSLGNLFAAELFVMMKKDNPAWEQQVAKGDFKMIREFMNKRVHEHAAFYDSPVLMNRVLGREIGTKAFGAYLKEKYHL